METSSNILYNNSEVTSILSHVIDFLNYDKRNTNAVIWRNSYVLLVIIMTGVIVFGHAVIFDIGLFNLAEKYKHLRFEKKKRINKNN